MKQVKLFTTVFIGLFWCGLASAETVKVFGDYTVSGTVDGDLIVTNGSVSIASGWLAVNGSLKVTSGKVSLLDGNLQVNGNLIVTNTQSSGMVDAAITATGDISVSGDISTKSINGLAHIGAYDKSTPIGVGSITAGSIATDGNAYVEAHHSIQVIGSINTNSDVGSAYIKSYGVAPVYGDVYAGSITTSAYEDGFVHVENGHLIVNGDIVTKSVTGQAYVQAEGDIDVVSISTNGDGASYVLGESIHALGNINTKSSNGKAYVESEYHGVTYGDIVASNIYTKGDSDSYVEAAGGIDVNGDIAVWVTGSVVCPGHIESNDGQINAANIFSHGGGWHYLKSAGGDIRVIGTIRLDGASNSHIDCGDGSVGANLYAGEVATQGREAFVRAYGNIDVQGSIVTKGTEFTGHVEALNSGDLKAENVFTNAVTTAHVYALGDIDVKDAIKTKSDGSYAYVLSSGELQAKTITTHGGNECYVESLGGSIIVNGDIRAKSMANNAYVKALSGSVNARSIKTEAPVGYDDSIQAAPGLGRFELVATATDGALTIKDSELYLDSDHEWNTLLTLDGTCTINGNGHVLTLGGSGGFLVASGATARLKNITIDKVGNNAFRCADNTATLNLESVTLTQTANLTFAQGAIGIYGTTLFKGSGKTLLYQSTQPIAIAKDSELVLGHNLILQYDASTITGITMVDETSRLHLFGGLLRASENLRLLNGTLVFDDYSSFIADTGKSIYFGNNVLANNINLEFHLGSEFNMQGTLVNNNV